MFSVSGEIVTGVLKLPTHAPLEREAGIVLRGTEGADILEGGTGPDTLIGGSGDDRLFGGTTAADLRDVIFAGAGDDYAEGGYGNDELRGDAGQDSLIGGFGVDTLIGGTGQDVLTGAGLGDILIGGSGDDFLNGGFGFDRLNGGTGADRFFHQGVLGHGTDWIQDYNFLQGDRLLFGAEASADDFRVNYALTPGAGEDTQAEAFVIYRPTNQILWALVDGHGQPQITVQANEAVFDVARENATVVGSAGVDAFFGGPGVDVVNFQQEGGPLGIRVNLSDESYVHEELTLPAGRATDSFGNANEHIASIETLHGTSQDDIMIGGDGNHLETFYTYGGRNFLDGGDGHSRYFLRGDLDGTVIHVGTSFLDTRDVLSFGFADNTVDTLGRISITGTGSSNSQFHHHLVFEALHTGVTVNLGATTTTHQTVAEGAIWQGGSLDFTDHAFFLEVEGSQFDDLIIGGNPAHEYLEWFHGNRGADTIHGGGGTDDTIIYEFENRDGPGVFVVLDDAGATTGLSTDALTRLYGFTVRSNGYAIDRYGDRDTLINIDDIRGSESADHMTGSAGANSFWGLDGNDTIIGGAGIDGAHYHSDLFFAEVGAPDLTQNGIIVDLVTGVVSNDGYGATDTLRGIENIFATEHNDRVTGNSAPNELRGYAGEDSLDGSWGNDTLVGGIGDDTLNGGGNNDVLIGQEGNDLLTGGAGRDLFDFNLGLGQDTVTDFELGLDVLRIKSILAAGATATEIASRAEATTDGVLLRFDGQGSIHLLGLNGVSTDDLADHIVYF